MNSTHTRKNIYKYMLIVSELLELGTEYLLANLGKCQVEMQKGNRDYALTTDIELEKLYKRKLVELYPDIPILGEELSPNIVSNTYEGLFWAIDSIDGTVNFSRQIPEYGTSIALIEQGKSIVAGVCFPSLRETYIAGIGAGAFLNGSRIVISKRSTLKSSILCFGDFSVNSNYIEENDFRLNCISAFANEVLRIRMPGSAALQLAWLASGKIDISLTLSNNAWDIQGGALLVKEAGGEVYDFDGSKHSISSKYTIASNSHNKDSILKIIDAIIAQK